MPSARASGSTTAATWLASSRVGTRISERGRLGWRLLSEAARRATSGRLKARVLPEPVRPRPSTSRPARLSGSVATWIGNGAVMPLAVSTSTSGAGTPRASKVVSVGRTVASAPTGTTTGAGTAGARPGRGAGGAAGRRPDGRRDRGRHGTGADGCRRSRWRTWGSCWVKSSDSSTLEWPYVHLGERERRRACTRAGRAHIVSETSDSRAHHGGAASARRRFLPLRMSEGGAGTYYSTRHRPRLVRSRGSHRSHRVSDRAPVGAPVGERRDADRRVQVLPQRGRACRNRPRRRPARPGCRSTPAAGGRRATRCCTSHWVADSPGLLAEAPGEGPHAHPRVRGEVGQGERLAEPLAGPRRGWPPSRVSPGSGTGRSTNCDWPPSRHGATTLRRATRLATSLPWSRRITCSSRSMPAALPGGGEDVAVVDEQHVGVQVDRGEQARRTPGRAPSAWWPAGRRAGPPRRARTRRCRSRPAAPTPPCAAAGRPARPAACRRSSRTSRRRRGSRRSAPSPGSRRRARAAPSSRPRCAPGRRRGVATRTR